MNKNPYAVLGVQENATDEQIKTAYRELAKKYHPDNYQDSPLADLATEKMQEINSAYEEIMKMRKEGRTYNGGYSGGNSSPYGNSGGHTAGNNYVRTNFPDVRNLINAGRLDDAETILNGTPTDKRDGEWNFLQGMINYRRGWTDRAYSYFSTACNMDPGNQEFRNVMNQMNRQRNYTSTEYNTVTRNGCGCSSCDVCTAICCADACCECMGGDLCRCC